MINPKKHIVNYILIFIYYLILFFNDFVLIIKIIIYTKKTQTKKC